MPEESEKLKSLLAPKRAKDATSDPFHKFLIAGIAGSGKTTLLRTLPGRKFVYVFDPNALESLKGDPLVDYLDFMPDRLPLNIRSLSKDKGDSRKVGSGHGAETYRKWEEHAENALATGFFADYDVVAFDSATTLLDLIMDRVLEINQRAGQWPNQDDYGPQMNTFIKIFRNFASLEKVLYLTAHVEMSQDKVTSKISWQPLMTGRLKVKIPTLFSSLLFAHADTDQSGKTRYVVQTRPDREFPGCRCSLKEVKFKEDVTIDFSKPLEDQGLGRLLKAETAAAATRGVSHK